MQYYFGASKRAGIATLNEPFRFHAQNFGRAPTVASGFGAHHGIRANELLPQRSEYVEILRSRERVVTELQRLDDVQTRWGSDNHAQAIGPQLVIFQRVSRGLLMHPI